MKVCEQNNMLLFIGCFVILLTNESSPIVADRTDWLNQTPHNIIHETGKI